VHWYRYGALRRDTSASERALNIAITMRVIQLAE